MAASLEETRRIAIEALVMATAVRRLVGDDLTQEERGKMAVRFEEIVIQVRKDIEALPAFK